MKLGRTLVLLAAVLVLFDLFCSGFNEWSDRHSWTVELATGAILIAFTALVVEHLIPIREARRWRAPSLLAIDAYVYPADRASQRIHTEFLTELGTLPSPPSGHWVFRTDEALELLITQRPNRLGTLSDVVRKETDELTLVAMQVSATLARDPSFSSAVSRVFDQQRRLGEVAEILNALRFMANGLAGPNASSVRRLVDENIQRADELLQEFLEELANLRLAVGEEVR